MPIVTTSSFITIIGYTTWNPSDKGPDTTLSNGNLTESTNTSGTYSSVRSVHGIADGEKKMYEIQLDSSSPNSYYRVGFGNSSALISSGGGGNGWVGATADSISYGGVGRLVLNNTIIWTTGSWGVGDVISAVLDRSGATDEYSFYVNGGFINSYQTNSLGSGTIYAMTSNNFLTNIHTATANFGASPFTASVAGFTGITA